VVGKGVFGVVVGQHTAGTEFADDRWQLAGKCVDMALHLIVLSVFNDGEVDVWILLAKRLESFIVATVTNMPDFFGPASFHENDYSFFYKNLQENVAKRIETYKNNAE